MSNQQPETARETALNNFAAHCEYCERCTNNTPYDLCPTGEALLDAIEQSNEVNQ